MGLNTKLQNPKTEKLTLITILVQKDPTRLASMHAYIDAFITANGVDCLGRRGSLEDCLVPPYREAYVELCEAMIVHPSIFNTANSKNIILTHSLMSSGHGCDILFETVRFVQAKYHDHVFGDHHWKSQEALVVGPRINQPFISKPCNFIVAEHVASTSTAEDPHVSTLVFQLEESADSNIVLYREPTSCCEKLELALKCVTEVLADGNAPVDAHCRSLIEKIRLAVTNTEENIASQDLLLDDDLYVPSDEDSDDGSDDSPALISTVASTSTASSGVARLAAARYNESLYENCLSARFNAPGESVFFKLHEKGSLNYHVH